MDGLNKLGQAVLADAQRASEEHRRRQRELFSKLYNKTKKFQFPKPEEVNMVKHFFCPKIFGPEGLGQTMSKAEMAVYPVLCSRADFKHDSEFQLPEEHIADMAGISIPTVAGAMRGLEKREFEGAPLIQRRKITERDRHFYVYHVNFIRKGTSSKYENSYFRFFTSIIDSGTWARLIPRAKCLYLAMRNMAQQNMETYYEIEAIDYNLYDISQADVNTYFKQRKWDLCTVPIVELCRHVNIEHTNMAPVIKQLRHFRLIKKVDRFVKVYLKPY
jgi:hypothetical protein